MKLNRFLTFNDSEYQAYLVSPCSAMLISCMEVTHVVDLYRLVVKWPSKEDRLVYQMVGFREK